MGHSNKGNIGLSTGRIRATDKEVARPPDLRAHDFFLSQFVFHGWVVFNFSENTLLCMCSASLISHHITAAITESQTAQHSNPTVRRSGTVVVLTTDHDDERLDIVIFLVLATLYEK